MGRGHRGNRFRVEKEGACLKQLSGDSTNRDDNAQALHRFKGHYSLPSVNQSQAALIIKVRKSDKCTNNLLTLRMCLAKV